MPNIILIVNIYLYLASGLNFRKWSRKERFSYNKYSTRGKFLKKIQARFHGCICTGIDDYSGLLRFDNCRGIDDCAGINWNDVFFHYLTGTT